MKKDLLNYSLMVIILLSLNLISFILVFFLYELSTNLNFILDCSVVVFFVISSIILSKFIRNKSLSILKSVIILYIIIAIFRFFEVIILKSSSGFMWCSIGTIKLLLNLILNQGSEYLDWWTIIIFPILQPLGVFTLYRIIQERRLK